MLSHRRVFNWFVYIALMYNIAAGMVSSILRVVGAALIGLLAMFRMDTIIYIKAFHRLDLGTVCVCVCVCVCHMRTACIVL